MYKYLLKNILFFELITQNYLIFFNLKQYSFSLVSSVHFYLLNNSFNEYNSDWFQSFFFLEWISSQRPFLLFNYFYVTCRKYWMYNFLIFLEIFLLPFNNIYFNSLYYTNFFLIFKIKSFRRIPILPNSFYNFKKDLNIKLTFNSFFFNLLSFSQKNNILSFILK